MILRATVESDNEENLEEFLDDFCFIANDKEIDNFKQYLKACIKTLLMLSKSANIWSCVEL